MSGSTAPTTVAAVAALAAGLQAVTEAVRAACTDPGDALGLLLLLAGYNPTSRAGADSIGLAMATVQIAVAAGCRRAALTSLARAAAAYAPSSYQDAVRVRGLVCAAIDAEIMVAGNSGDYATYAALRALRAAVVLDLTTRAGSLAQVATITRPAPQPALVVAYDLYDDASRYDDLVRRVDPVSPLFLPRTFQALTA